jgi:DNA mismatch repair protein MutS2
MSPADSAAALGSLEFAAVLDVVASRAAGSLAAERIRSLRPTLNQADIVHELSLVGELLVLLRRGESLEVPAVPDVRGALKRIRVPGSVLDLGELVDVRRTLTAGRLISAELARVAEAAPGLGALRVSPIDGTIERLLERAVDDDGQLLDSASPQLAAARREVHSARERLIAKLERILAALGPAAGGAVTVREGRYVIPVRRDARSRPEGIIHDESGSAGTLFIEPSAAIDLGNAVRAAVLAEERAVLAVLRELTERLRPVQAELMALHAMAVEVDTVMARGRWAHDCDAEVPTITGVGGDLHLRRARHPLLLARGIDVVPFDLTLEGAERTLLISGPNTGGKTVLLKAAALTVLLAQSGVVPPVDAGSAVPLLTGIFVDIGDHQSLQADLSTFSAHVAELRRILESADRGAMVILDEVGSGTDPAEGGALAMAVLEELTGRGVLTLATTHLGSLKSLAERVDGVVNGSLHFDAATLSPTYRFTKGIPGRSYGLAIARRLGVPDRVLAVAERLVPEAERELDRLLAAIEARQQEVTRREASLAERDLDVGRREQVAERRESRQAERETVLVRQEKEAEREQAKRAKAYLLEARKRVEEALSLARGAADDARATEARRLVEEGVRQEADRLAEEEVPMVGDPSRLLVGCRVRLSTGATGELLELRSDGRAVVTVGAMRLVVKAQSLARLADADRPARPRFQLPMGDAPEREAASEIDLRGMRADEAEQEVFAALDGSVLADHPELRIIHGMGTGVLRDVVQQLLARDSRVASFGFAPRNLGGTGVTIVVLK